MNNSRKAHQPTLWPRNSVLREGRIGHLRQPGPLDDVEGVLLRPIAPALEQAGVAGEVEHQQGDQHEHAAHEREEEELDRRVFPPRPAPDADEKVHRQEHHFPEDVEEEEVQRHEDAQHARLQEEEEDAIGADVFLDRPTGPHRQHAEERSEHDQRQADAVQAEMVVDVEGRNPGRGRPRIASRPSSSEKPTAPAEVPGSAIQTVSAKTMIVVMKENCFIVSSCPLGKNRSTKAATVGRKMIRLINTVGSERAFE